MEDMRTEHTLNNRTAKLQFAPELMERAVGERNGIELDHRVVTSETDDGHYCQFERARRHTEGMGC